MGEGNANDISDKVLISKIYKELIELNIKKQTTQLKNGQRTKKKMNIFPKKIYRWPTDICSTSLITREMQIKTTMRESSHIAQGDQLSALCPPRGVG